MSLEDLYTPVPIIDYDDVAATSSVEEMQDEVGKAFEQVKISIGNLDGSLEAPHIKSTSIAGELGDIEGFSPEKPFGVEFTGYEQVFNDPGRKEFILDLIPGLSTDPIILSDSDPATTWTREASLSDLAQEGDYVIIGRSIFFYIQPSGPFKITYNGTYPEHDGGIENGYMPNIYPSELLVSSESNKPTLTYISGNRYRLEFYEANKNNRLEPFGSNLSLEYNTVLSAYVSASNYNEAPLDYVSVWIRRSGGTFYKLDCSAIYLKSNVEIEFDTEEPLNPLSDTLVLVLSNVSLSDVVKATAQLLQNHTHDRFGLTQSISHENLRDLIPVSENPEINYGGSLTPGNDHPQYFHREGFKDDPGTYNNSILGDLHIGSQDKDSLFNNTLADSNRISFGSVSNGVSLKYSRTTDDEGILLLAGATDGLEIQSLETGLQGKESDALVINNHSIFNWREGPDRFLSIGSDSGNVRFSNNDGDELGDIYLNKAFAATIDATGSINLLDGSTFNLGEISFEVDGNNVDMGGLGSLNFNSPVNFEHSNHNELEVQDITVSGELTIDDQASIKFAPSDSLKWEQISESPGVGSPITEQSIVARLDNPLRFANTGRRNGISFGLDTLPFTNEYATIYTAAPSGGASSPVTSDTYLELGDETSSLYLIKRTVGPLTLNGSTYLFQESSPGATRYDSLHEWPRADLFAGQADFKKVQVAASESGERNGVAFGSNANIYVTGPGGNCPSGWMVVESANGVVFVDSAGESIDCSNLNYSNISASDINAFGSVLAQDTITAGKSIRSAGDITGETLSIALDSQLEGNLRVKGETILEQDLTSFAGASFNTDVTVKGSLKVENVSNLNTVNIDGVSTFNEIARFHSNAYIDDLLSVGSELNVAGISSFTGEMRTGQIRSGDIIALSVTSTGELRGNSNLSIGGLARFESGVNVARALVVGDGISNEGPLTTKSLSVENASLFSGAIQVESDAVFKRAVNLVGTNQLTVAGPALFSSKTTHSGGLDVGGATKLGGTLEVGGAITGSSLSMSSGASINGSIQVGGSINTKTIVIQDSITVGGASNSMTAFTANSGTFQGDLAVMGKILVNDVEIFGDVSSSNSRFATLVVEGGITQTGAGASNTYSGSNRFNGSSVFVGPATADQFTIKALTLNGIMSAGNNRITNLAPPTQPTDAVNRAYIDNMIPVGGTAGMVLTRNSAQAGGSAVWTEWKTISSGGSTTAFDGNMRGERLRNLGSPIDNGDAVPFSLLNARVPTNGSAGQVLTHTGNGTAWTTLSSSGSGGTGDGWNYIATQDISMSGHQIRGLSSSQSDGLSDIAVSMGTLNNRIRHPGSGTQLVAVINQGGAPQWMNESSFKQMFNIGGGSGGSGNVINLADISSDDTGNLLGNAPGVLIRTSASSSGTKDGYVFSRVQQSSAPYPKVLQVGRGNATNNQPGTLSWGYARYVPEVNSGMADGLVLTRVRSGTDGAVTPGIGTGPGYAWRPLPTQSGGGSSATIVGSLTQGQITMGPVKMMFGQITINGGHAYNSIFAAHLPSFFSEILNVQLTSSASNGRSGGSMEHSPIDDTYWFWLRDASSPTYLAVGSYGFRTKGVWPPDRSETISYLIIGR